jgi:hypothetical protein
VVILLHGPRYKSQKNKGGLRVINLRLQNDALLLKQLNNFYNHCDIPWVNLIWAKYYLAKVSHPDLRANPNARIHVRQNQVTHMHGLSEYQNTV